MKKDYHILHEKLDLLRKKDKRFKIFGSSKHQYKLGPLLSEAKIQEYEKKINISIPKEYRTFLKEVGSRGGGPYYGLYPLEKYWDENVAQPFLYPPTYSEVLKIEKENEKEFGEDEYGVPKGNPDEIIYNPGRGILIIGTQGCAYDFGLVITGEERGNMFLFVDPGWIPMIKNNDKILDQNGNVFKMDFNSVDQKLWETYYNQLYAEQNKKLRITFYDWYLEWLNEGLA